MHVYVGGGRETIRDCGKEKDISSRVGKRKRNGVHMA